MRSRDQLLSRSIRSRRRESPRSSSMQCVTNGSRRPDFNPFWNRDMCDGRLGRILVERVGESAELMADEWIRGGSGLILKRAPAKCECEHENSDAHHEGDDSSSEVAGPCSDDDDRSQNGRDDGAPTRLVEERHGEQGGRWDVGGQASKDECNGDDDANCEVRRILGRARKGPKCTDNAPDVQ